MGCDQAKNAKSIRCRTAHRVAREARSCTPELLSEAPCRASYLFLSGLRCEGLGGD